MSELSIQDIKRAKENFGDFVKTTPLEYSNRLSKLYDAEIYIKREDLQPVRSYKIRGAYNLINSLSSEEKQAGVVAASAGNHAQGVAISCKKLGIKGTIFMPVTTPSQKVYKTKQFGGEFIEVILVGDTFDEAFNQSKEYEKKHNTTFVHPFDDMRIIEGQATIGLEIFQEMKKTPDYIVCPIGGGGVVSGLIKISKELNKKTKIIGAEPEGASGMKNSINTGKNVSLNSIDIFVDGAAVKKEGDTTFQISKDYGLKIVSCPENRICTTMLDYLHEEGIIVEPAGALATDALKDLKKEIKGKKVVVIISGGNFDFERLPEVKERSMKYEGLKRYYMINFPQRPGALKDFLKCLGDEDDIERFEYLKKSAKNTAPVFMGIKSKDKTNFSKIEECMTSKGFKFNDVTNNQLYFDLLI